MEHISKIFKIQNSPSLQIKELSEQSKNLEKLSTPHSCLIPWKIAELKMLCPSTEQIQINTKVYSKCKTGHVTCEVINVKL